METRKRHHVKSLVGELVYARVLLALEREQLRRRDETLRDRLDALLAEIPNEERWQICESALERAWARAERDAGPCEDDADEAEIRAPAQDSGDIAA